METHADVGVALLGVAGIGGGARGAGAADGELGALGVPLGVVGLVEGDELVADEVVAGGEPGGDGAGEALVTTNELGDAPAAGGLGVEEDGGAVAGEARLVDLEPAGAGAVAGGEVAGALVHPDDDGALGVRPLGPDGLDGVAGDDGRRELGRGAAVAAELGVVGRQRRVVVGPLALDHGVGAGREAVVAAWRLVAGNVKGGRVGCEDGEGGSPGVVGAGNHVAGDGAVGSRAGGEQADGGKSGGRDHGDGAQDETRLLYAMRRREEVLEMQGNRRRLLIGTLSESMPLYCILALQPRHTCLPSSRHPTPGLPPLYGVPFQRYLAIETISHVRWHMTIDDTPARNESTILTTPFLRQRD